MEIRVLRGDLECRVHVLAAVADNDVVPLLGVVAKDLDLLALVHSLGVGDLGPLFLQPSEPLEPGLIPGLVVHEPREEDRYPLARRSLFLGTRRERTDIKSHDQDQNG